MSYNGNTRYSRENNQCRLYNHNHEFLTSTNYEKDEGCAEHNHRIAGVTGPPIRYGESHVHRIAVLTDTFNDHYHRVCDTTGPALYLSSGKHIHLLKGSTDSSEDHDHDYYFTTLVEDQTTVPRERHC